MDLFSQLVKQPGFISFSFISYALLLFLTFVLEAFILEYSFCKSKLENDMEKKISEMGLQLGRPIAKSSKSTDKENLVIDSEDIVEYVEERQTSLYPNLSEETGIRFHLAKSKNVENLLQRMFENELDDVEEV